VVNFPQRWRQAERFRHEAFPPKPAILNANVDSATFSAARRLAAGQVRAEGDILTKSCELAAEVSAALAQRIGSQRYQLWFADKTRFSLLDDLLRVGVPNRFYLDWLEKTFTPILREVLEASLGRPGRVQFVIEPSLFQASREAQKELAASTLAWEPGANGTPVVPATTAASRPALPQRRFLSLKDFVVGPSNRLAHAAALNLLDRPDSASLPLTIYGQPGVGKTHLLEGIFSERQQRLGEAAGVFITAEEFTNRFLPAMHSRQLGPFRKQFREAQALFIDDLHFFSGKEATQREFLHTFETLRKLGRVVAATSACHPRQLPGFLPELADRLQGGGAWEIELPDSETRRALLMAKSARLGCRLPLDVLDFLSVNLRGNVRELEGALTAIQHYSKVQHLPVDLQLVRAALGQLLQEARRAVDIRDVETAVCQVLGCERKTLHAQSRSRSVTYPRMLAMYLARRCTQSSYAEIGHFFGRRKHSTVIAAERKVAGWIDAEKAYPLADRPATWRSVAAEVERRLRTG